MGRGLSSITGNYGSYKQHQTSAKVAEANARVTEAQGKASKAQAYGKAARMDAENEHAGRVASENLGRLGENKSKTLGSVNAARGSSGFTQQGSGSQPAISALKQFEQVAADMRYSRSIQDQSARFNSAMMRQSGDLALTSAEATSEYQMAQAQVYKMMSDNAKTAYITSAITTGLGAAIGGIAGGGAGALTGANFGSSMAEAVDIGAIGSTESQQGISKLGVNTIDKALWDWLS